MSSTKFTHDKTLFTKENKDPIKFSMRSCEERAKLSPYIQYGGGMITGKSSPDCIRLIEPGGKVLVVNNTSVTSQYVWDCIEKNKLLNLEDYRQKPEDISDIEDGDTYNLKVVMKARNTRTRQDYSVVDELKILEFINKHHRHAEVKGKALWIAMEELKVLNRTWQSMKEHFLKAMMPKISSYNLSKEEEKKFHKPFSNELKKYGSSSDISISDDSTKEDKEDDDDEQNKDPKAKKHKEKKLKKHDRLKQQLGINSNRYTMEIDKEILYFILSTEDNIYQIKGTTIWKRMNINKVTTHSWQSMKERFLKRILPNIDSYVLPPKYHKLLEKLKEYCSKTRKTSADSDSSSTHSRRLKRLLADDTTSESDFQAEEDRNLQRKSSSRLFMHLEDPLKINFINTNSRKKMKTCCESDISLCKMEDMTGISSNSDVESSCIKLSSCSSFQSKTENSPHHEEEVKEQKNNNVQGVELSRTSVIAGNKNEHFLEEIGSKTLETDDDDVQRLSAESDEFFASAVEQTDENLELEDLQEGNNSLDVKENTVIEVHTEKMSPLKIFPSTKNKITPNETSDGNTNILPPKDDLEIDLDKSTKSAENDFSSQGFGFRNLIEDMNTEDDLTLESKSTDNDNENFYTPKESLEFSSAKNDTLSCEINDLPTSGTLKMKESEQDSAESMLIDEIPKNNTDDSLINELVMFEKEKDMKDASLDILLESECLPSQDVEQMQTQEFDSSNSCLSKEIGDLDGKLDGLNPDGSHTENQLTTKIACSESDSLLITSNEGGNASLPSDSTKHSITKRFMKELKNIQQVPLNGNEKETDILTNVKLDKYGFSDTKIADNQLEKNHSSSSYSQNSKRLLKDTSSEDDSETSSKIKVQRGSERFKEPQEYRIISGSDQVQIIDDQANLQLASSIGEKKERTSKKILNPRERLLKKYCKSDAEDDTVNSILSENSSLDSSETELSDETEHYISEDSNEVEDDETFKARLDLLYEEFQQLPHNISHLTHEDIGQAFKILQSFLDISQVELKCLLDKHNWDIKSLLSSLIEDVSVKNL